MIAQALQVSFTVEGEPVPQGSMSAFVPEHSKTGRPIITSANPKLKQWRQTVRACALKAMGFENPAGAKVPIRVELVFYFRRPQSVKAIDKTTRPDIDKCARAILDSLTQVVFTDDAQVTEMHCLKAYGNPRVEIRVEEADMVAEEPMKREFVRDSQLPF